MFRVKTLFADSRIWFVICMAGALPCLGGSGPADSKFTSLAQEYLQGFLAWRPQQGTTLGLHEYDGKVTDFDAASLSTERARLRAFDERLGQIRPEDLSPQGLYDFKILRGAIKRELFGFDEMRIYWKNPMTYAGVLDVNIYVKRNFAPLEARARGITAVLNAAPKIFAAARANLDESLPRPEIELAMDQANGAVDFLGKDLVDALAQIKDSKLMADFKVANDRAIAELKQYSAYLKEQKLPKANEDYALGPEKYSRLLEYGEMIALSPDQLLEIGLRELHAKQTVFAEAAHQIDPGKTPVEVFQAIQKDHPTEQKLIPDTARDLETIRQFLVDHRIIGLPSQVRAQVTETPQFLRATSFASMDTPGPFETKATEAYYYVTPPENDWGAQQKEEWLTAFNYYTTDIVSIHEAYPGHYVQFLHLNASPATRLEKIFGSYAFIEGWAHYAEQMMVDEGFGAQGNGPGSDPHSSASAAKYLLAQTDEALLRACRFCVSVKMHCQKMSVDEATRFFQQNCYYEEKPAHQEAMRGTFDPEYLYYTVGKLEILKLREDYRKQQGGKFSLREFHDEMLRHGAPPIQLLRELMLKDRGIWSQVF
jgi:uncharacterized protein (DUF885 family)